MRAGRGGLAAGIRLDQLHDRFGPRQVQLPVDKGAAGELARLRHTHAKPAQRAQRQPEHSGRAVAGQLHHVLAGIGARPGERGEHAVVERRAVRIAQRAVYRPPVPDTVRPGKERPGRCERVRAADPYYADRRRLHGRDRRADRIVSILHLFSTAFFRLFCYKRRFRVFERFTARPARLFPLPRPCARPVCVTLVCARNALRRIAGAPAGYLRIACRVYAVTR